MAISTTIEVVIKKVENHHGKVWSVEPKDEDANKERVKKHKEKIEDNWHDRHGKVLDLRHHRPIVFLEGETLNFTCEGGFRFAIGAKKNPDVDEFPGTPDNPFGWDGFQLVAERGSKSALVIPTTADGPGPRHQRFYKFHGWVLENGEFKPVDPDGYCGS